MTLKIASVLDGVIRYFKRNEVINIQWKNACVIVRDCVYKPDKLGGKKQKTRKYFSLALAT